MGALDRLSRLEMLLDISRLLGATVELHPLLTLVEQQARRLLRCQRVSILLYDPRRDELYSEVATGVPALRFPADRGLAGEALRSGKIINVPDAYLDERFNPAVDQQTGFRTRSLLCVPLHGLDNRPTGVLQLLNKEGGPFDEDDEYAAGVLGAQVGVALQRQRLLEEFAVKQRMQRDLNIARQIQQALLPREAPAVAGYDIAAWNRPADETGGDCYDYFLTPRGELALLVADATGHGIGPALTVSACRAMLRCASQLSAHIEDVVRQTNTLLYQDLPGGRFITAFFAWLDARAHRLAWVAAGQGPILLFDPDSGTAQWLAASDPPLGVLPDLAVQPTHPLDLPPGRILAVLTDGFYEAENAAGHAFGRERVLEVLRRRADQPVGSTLEDLVREVDAFTAGVPQRDDLTALLVRRIPP